MFYPSKTVFFAKYKKELITLLLAATCLLLFLLFPAQGIAQEITASLIFLLAIPAIFLRRVLREELRDHGWQKGDLLTGLIYASAALFLSLAAYVALYHYTDFDQNYRLPASVINNFGYFLLYEFVLNGFFLALYEFFFRGFLMFSFVKTSGFYAPILQFVLFFIFLYLSGNLIWNYAIYLLAAFFGGIIAYKSRSLIYSFSFALLLIFITDTLFIKFIHN